MIYKQQAGEVIYDEAGALGVRLAQCHQCDFVKVTVQPGSRVALHVMEVPVTFFVIAGCALLHIDETSRRVEAGDLIAVPCGCSRGWTNDGSAVLEFLAVKHGTFSV